MAGVAIDKSYKIYYTCFMKNESSKKVNRHPKWNGLLFFGSLTVLFLVMVTLTIANTITNNQNGSMANLPAETTATVQKPATSQELFEAVNQERVKAGVAPLVLDEKLSTSAQWKADKMNATGNFSHTDENGKNDGLDYLGSLNANCTYVSENLSWSNISKETQTAEEAITAWMNSETHRKALLSSEFTSTGFGVSDGIAVEHFCKP